MPNLKCNVNDCKFNCCSKCTKNQISIGAWMALKPKDIECQDYQKGINFFSEEFAKELFQEEKETIISCKATDCIHNSSSVCVAREITVEPCDNCKIETVCVSYCKDTKRSKVD